MIKDCDKALQLDPLLVQAYILKGRAFSALGRKEDAITVLEKGYEYAVRQSTDLKQLLELEELLTVARQDDASKKHSGESREPMPLRSIISNETFHKESSNGQELGNSCNGKIKFDHEVKENKSVDQVGSNKRSNNGSDVKREANSAMEIHIKTANGEFRIQSNRADGQGTNKKLPNTTEGKSNSIVEVEDNGKVNIHENGSREKQSNGTVEMAAKAGGVNNKSGADLQLSELTNESSGISEVGSRSGEKSDLNDDPSGESRKNKKLHVSRISKTKSINIDFRLSRGIAQVNEGNYAQAVSIFDQILQEDPTYPEALIGRGTAYAFKRELHAAISDFTKAIESNQAAGEAWKRRGQARAALGDFSEAIADLTEGLKFEENSTDILHERGIVNFKYKDFKSAAEDLSTCVKLDKSNKSALTYLGLALSPLGEYRRAEEAHLKSIKVDRNFVEAWGHLAQFYQELADTEKALKTLENLRQIDGSFVKAYHQRGLILHGTGDHKNAIKELSAGLKIDSSNVECIYLRASCYHATGEYKEAVKDYDAALDLELDSVDKFVLQCLAFYQKEIALYTASKLNSEFCWFDIDGDIDPLFKEYWCKMLHPKDVCEKVYRQPPLRDSLRKGKHKKHDFALNKQRTALLQVADSIGQKIQYHCPGFFANRRQHRMAGLAALEIAQKVSKFWRSLLVELKHSNKGASKNGKKIRRKEKTNPLSYNRGGAGCSTSSFSETSSSYSSPEDRLPGRYSMSWHDVYSLAVRWRQISEPCDPVVWVNKLSEEFNSGFGSHTPLVLGQAKVVRYFPHFQRTLDVAKAVIKENKFVRDKKDNVIFLSGEGKLQNVLNAESCSDLYQAIGQDFWCSTWCNSTACEGKTLEGTRITLVKMGDDKFDFAIRTPCTPSRWDEFSVEMTSAWEALCDAYSGDTHGSTDFDALENVRDAVLRMTYYWYNFMPLSRGTAAVGFIVLLGLLLAANMEFSGSIPKGLQVDWEAILSFDPSPFMNSVKSWLYPSLKITTSWKSCPDVASTLDTVGSVVTALSSFSD